MGKVVSLDVWRRTMRPVSPHNRLRHQISDAQNDHVASGHAYQVMMGSITGIVMPGTVDLPALGFTSMAGLFKLSDKGDKCGTRDAFEQRQNFAGRPDQGSPDQSNAASGLVTHSANSMESGD